MNKNNDSRKIAFLGKPGSYSQMACRGAYPDLDTISCLSFEDIFRAVKDGVADLAMIPVDNTIAGRVADVHHLLPEGGLHIVGEYFQPIEHALLGVAGASLSDLKHVHSHTHALPQCRNKINEMGLEKHVHADTASAALYVSEAKDKTQGAIASTLSADIYGLDVLLPDIQDASHNTTRFLVLARDMDVPVYDDAQTYLTTLFFHVRHIPAALYKSLGGFATNGINMAKLESYVDEHFQAAQFYCDVEAHPAQDSFKHAMEDLQFYAQELRVLGTYKAHPFRQKK